MIITKLRGGLGNQMFQYAAGRRLAQHNHTSLKIDKSWYTVLQDPNAPALRRYELDCFSFKPDFADRLDLGRVKAPPQTLKRRVYRTLRGPIKLYAEPEEGAFMPEVLVAQDNSCLNGWWHSEKYFKGSENAIRRDFQFKKPAVGKNLELIQQIKKVNAISLHVRRGDYITHPEINALYGLSMADYYKAAIKLMLSKVKNPHFFVISDDPVWCKKNIVIDSPTTYVDHNTEGSEDMRLMSLCQHHIIANSSFSWWGAWLNPSPDKIVVAPKQWFLNSKMGHSSILPEEWVKL